MFLATTALSEFWDTSQDILFLGSWCLRLDRRSEWKALRYQVMPSPWRDRKRFYDAAGYIDECGERMLDRLTEYLNSVHGVRHSPRYWRILIGPWLLHHLHALYDRYVHLTEAFSRYPDLQTIALDPESFRVPMDTEGFVEWALDDPYNLQIFSQLISGMGHRAPRRTFSDGWPMARNGAPAEGGVWRGGATALARSSVSLLWNALGSILQRRSQIALCNVQASRGMVGRIAWHSGLQAFPMSLRRRWSFTAPDPVFDRRRRGLAELPSSDSFEQLLVRSLPQNFPVLYLETYQAARTETLRNGGAFPRVIVSAAWHFDEPFNYLAAEAAERGSRLVAVQHGGGYGMYRFSAPELHESRVADSFFVWGWADEKTKSHRNLPSPRLSSLASDRISRHADRKRDKVLFVSTAYLQYLLRFHSSPVGIQCEEYFEWQLRFLGALPTRVRRAVHFRLASQGDERARREQIAGRFEDLRWDKGEALYSSLRGSRLVVVDYVGTTLLEALRCGVPTILFWNLHWSEVRKEAEPYLEDLRRAGVLWDSPEAAAGKLAEVYEDPWTWWGRQAVQDARRRFVDRYALARDDWVTWWTKALKAELGTSRGESVRELRPSG